MVTSFSGGNMTGGDEHREAQDLLPWFVTGRLDAEEQARVEAHVAGCPDCQRDVAFQKRLESEVARLPVDVEGGWSRMRMKVEAEAAGPVRRVARLAQGRAAWLGWGIAASVPLAVGAALLPPAVEASYHALGAAPAAPAGNVVVIFRPDATEAEMRGLLKAAHARMVDGPTAADAYVLAAPPAERDAALKLLKAQRLVVLAEPVDAP